MTQETLALTKKEQAAFGMRALFERFGYRRFEMSTFEEYDFYAENRKFLEDERILTFAGLDGRLLAMKPDVTLSIVKNTKGSLEKPDRVYYHENVYRARKGEGEYKEILQTGLEYIGRVDGYATLETLLLALKSLELIDSDYVLGLSHMGFLAGMLEETGLGRKAKKALLTCIREKNVHGIQALGENGEISGREQSRFAALAEISGPISEALKKAEQLAVNEKMKHAVRELKELSQGLMACGYGERVHLDFSLVNDLDYYNGIMFQGYINGIPAGILRGGRYDSLMARFGKKTEAIGFAVYLDLLERFGNERKLYDADVLLLYGEEETPGEVASAAARETENGETVIVRRGAAGDVRCRRTVDLRKGGRTDGCHA